MKFKMVESIVEDVQQEYEKRQGVIEEARKLLTDADFTESKKLNGIAFNKVVKEKSDESAQVEAQIYIDTTTYEYSCYVTYDNKTTATNFSSKGNIDTLISAVKRFLFEVEGI